MPIVSWIFSSMAHLLNLDLEIVLRDTSTYWVVEVTEEFAEADEPAGDDEIDSPAEGATRRSRHSKDHRPEPAADGDRNDGDPVRGIPLAFSGNTADIAIIRTAIDDLGG